MSSWPECSHDCGVMSMLGAGECDSICPEKFQADGRPYKSKDRYYVIFKSHLGDHYATSPIYSWDLACQHRDTAPPGAHPVIVKEVGDG